MTRQAAIINDPKYRPVLDHGFVGLVDHMGSDAAIVQAARVSYGDGTKTVREDRGLIRYLMRHRHTSPFEMCQVKIHVKAPIFVVRQWVRHRTASMNEYSGRYSVMSDEFYIPQTDVIQPQSTDNAQGRAGELSQKDREGAQWLMKAACDSNYDIYRTLLGERTAKDGSNNLPYDPYPFSDDIESDDSLLTNSFPGVAREMARSVLPVANYSEFYWSQNLHNILHLLKLRADSHAQYEIRAFAEALLSIIEPLYPLTVESWNDYVREAETLSRMEVSLLKDLLARGNASGHLLAAIQENGGEDSYIERNGLSKREWRELRHRWGL